MLTENVVTDGEILRPDLDLFQRSDPDSNYSRGLDSESVISTQIRRTDQNNKMSRSIVLPRKVII